MTDPRELRRHEQSGFTLIELLVVIVILGILAAVVVFSVSGVSDRGRDSAVAIEARIIRTAQEAYRAREGAYAGDVQDLEDRGYLSSAPQYHTVVTIGGGTGYAVVRFPAPATATFLEYQGRDGSTALALLDEIADIETQTFDFGTFVTSINGRAAGAREFWAFYVNDEYAQVGADSYVTSSTDIITWKLEGF